VKDIKMALDGTNFEKIKPLVLDESSRISKQSGTETMIQVLLESYDEDNGKPTSKPNLSVIRAIAAHVEKDMGFVETSQKLSDGLSGNSDMLAELRDHFTACEILNKNGAKTVVARLVRNDNNPDSLSPLMRAKYDAALDVVQSNEAVSFKNAHAKYEQSVLDDVKKEMMAAVSDVAVKSSQDANYKEVNVVVDDYSAKKLAEAMDKIDPKAHEALKSDSETYNQALIDIQNITLMHGKPYGFSSKAKAINAKVKQHVEAVYEKGMPNVEALRGRLIEAQNANPDFQQSMDLSPAALINMMSLVNASDLTSIKTLQKDKTGYRQTLLEISKISQSDQKDKASTVQNIIDERVANPIDKGVGRKISDNVKSAVVAFAAVAGTAMSLKPKMAMAKPVLSKVGTSLIGKKGIAAMFGAVMALGATTNAVDQDGGVTAISMADAGVQVVTNFDGFVANTGYEDPIMRTAIDTFVANSADATTVIAAAATIMDAVGDGKINGEAPAGAALVEAGEVDINQSVMTMDKAVALSVAEATIQEYSDLEGGDVSVSDDVNMSYMVEYTGVSYSLDGLFGTDGVATERLQAVAEIGSTIAQNALDRLEASNATGLTPYLVPEGQTLTHFIESNPELQAFANSSDVLLPSQETTMIAVALKEVNPGITNINQISAGGVYMVPSAERLAELINITEQPSRELIQEVRNDNRDAGLNM
jgi:hypothetical protein